MDFLIHIGDAKCGSTAIQAGLWSARQRLLQQGILYHPAQPSNGHYAYSVLLGAKTRGDDMLHEQLARQNVDEMRMRVAAERPRCVILSGESLFHRRPEGLARLCREISGEDNRLYVVAFLRHPVPLYLSQVQQQLTGSARFTHPSRFLPEKVGPLQAWMDFPDREELIVRLFDRNHLAQGSVIAELGTILHTLFNVTPSTLQDITLNESLSAEQIVIMQAYRRDVLPNKDNQYDRGAHEVVKMFNRLNRLEGRVGTRAMLLPAVERIIATQNQTTTNALDTMFPNLNMASAWREPVALNTRKSEDIWREDDVTSILQPVDTEVMAALMAKIPEMTGTS